MKRNKPRLALALYARPKYPKSYHYALLLIPKAGIARSNCTATKFHALDTLQDVAGELAQTWRYEAASVANLQDETWLLACIIIAKVKDEATLMGRLEAVPVYQVDDPDAAKADAFDCTVWAREAAESLRASTAVASLAPFDEIEQTALKYVERKKAEGRWTVPGRPGKPTWDFLQNREIVE